MREILFRGQRIDNGEWIEGFYFYKDRTSQHGIHCSTSMGVLVDREFEVIPETVVQFTGLTDKNGVKIFEGDKVKWANEDTIYTVEFDRGSFVCVNVDTSFNLSDYPSCEYKLI